jgi:hypothetical protein
MGLVVVTAGPAQAGAARCPEQLPADQAGFEQVGAAPRKVARLDRLRLFDGPPGEEAKPAPAELAPDRTAQRGGSIGTTWRFAGDESLLMVCAYRGTAAYYRATLNPLPRSCTMQRGASRTAASCE